MAFKIIEPHNNNMLFKLKVLADSPKNPKFHRTNTRDAENTPMKKATKLIETKTSFTSNFLELI